MDSINGRISISAFSSIFAAFFRILILLVLILAVSFDTAYGDVGGIVRFIGNHQVILRIPVSENRYAKLYRNDTFITQFGPGEHDHLDQGLSKGVTYTYKLEECENDQPDPARTTSNEVTTGEVEGYIDTELTWSGDYSLVGTVYVWGGTLTISPGSIVHPDENAIFDGYNVGLLNLGGTLIANEVIFTDAPIVTGPGNAVTINMSGCVLNGTPIKEYDSYNWDPAPIEFMHILDCEIRNSSIQVVADNIDFSRNKEFESGSGFLIDLRAITNFNSILNDQLPHFALQASRTASHFPIYIENNSFSSIRVFSDEPIANSVQIKQNIAKEEISVSNYTGEILVEGNEADSISLGNCTGEDGGKVVRSNTVKRYLTLIDCSHIRVENNRVSPSTPGEDGTGVNLTGITDCVITGNDLINCDWGIRLSGYDQNVAATNNTIRNNTVIGPFTTNVSLVGDVRDNMFFNNFFYGSSEKNIDISYLDCYSGCANIWNAERSAGENIAGGNFLGGNFWYHYVGAADTDQDLIFDTPFIINDENTDHFPLVTTKLYTLESKPVPEFGGGITVNPLKNYYDPDEPVTLEATPNPGYVFNGWRCEPEYTSNPVTISMTGNTDFWACFKGLNCTRGCGKCPGVVGEPIQTATGEYYTPTFVDINLAGPLPLSFSRRYASRLYVEKAVNSGLGENWIHNFDLRIKRISGTLLEVVYDWGKIILFHKDGKWNLANPEEIIYQLEEDDTGNFWLMDPTKKLVYRFDAQGGKLTEIHDRNGHLLSLAYDGSGNLAAVTDGLGRTLTFSYTGDRLIRLSHQDRFLTYEYDDDGHLVRFNDALGNATTYAYDTSKAGLGPLLTGITHPLENRHHEQTFDDRGRVTEQKSGDNHSITLSYDQTDAGTTLINERDGTERRDTHLSPTLLKATRDAFGNTLHYGYDDNHRRTTIMNRCGRMSAITYHEKTGVLSSATDAEGNTFATAYTEQQQTIGPVTFTFHVFSRLVYPDGSSERFTHDDRGNIVSRIDRGVARKQRNRC